MGATYGAIDEHFFSIDPLVFLGEKDVGSDMNSDGLANLPVVNVPLAPNEEPSPTPSNVNTPVTNTPTNLQPVGLNPTPPVVVASPWQSQPPSALTPPPTSGKPTPSPQTIPTTQLAIDR